MRDLLKAALRSRKEAQREADRQRSRADQLARWLDEANQREREWQKLVVWWRVEAQRLRLLQRDAPDRPTVH